MKEFDSKKVDKAVKNFKTKKQVLDVEATEKKVKEKELVNGKIEPVYKEIDDILDKLAFSNAIRRAFGKEERNG